MNLLDFFLLLSAKYMLVERNGTISVIIHKDSTAADILQSFVHAHVMVTLLDKSISLHIESQSWMEKQYEDFLQKVIEDSLTNMHF